MPIFYITRDIERAAGSLGSYGGVVDLRRSVRDAYMRPLQVTVITNPGPLAEALGKKYSEQVHIVPHRRGQACLTPTIELIRSEFVQKKAQELARGEKPNIIVFKNSPQIERECGKNGWRLLNPPCEAGAVLEEKIEQWHWLQSIVGANSIRPRLGEYNIFPYNRENWQLPQVWVGELSSRSYKELASELGEQPIVQFNRGHTGLGTLRLESESQWKELQKIFPKREVKVSCWYDGETYTVNAIAFTKSKSAYGGKSQNSKVIVGNISKQLTGILGCTTNPYATVGNDWSEGSRLPEEMKRKIYSCAEMVGEALVARGYRGLFGIDVIVTKEGRVILIEVNPRQPASASLESQLQRGDLTVMEWHVMALMSEASSDATDVENCSVAARLSLTGYQLFFRNVKNYPVQLKNEFMSGRYRMSDRGVEFVEKATSVQETKKDEVFAFSVSKREVVKPGGELLRIQSKRGMIDALGNKPEASIRALRAQISIT